MNSGIRFTIRLTPKGGRNALDGWQEAPDGARYLKARVSAPAAEGKANDALIRLLAKGLHVGVTRVQIVSGVTSRTKVIEVEALPALPAGFGEER